MVGRVAAIDRSPERSSSVGPGATCGRGGRRASLPAIDPGDDALWRPASAVGRRPGYRGSFAAAGRRAGLCLRADALGDLARASGFHVRPVTLDEAWWRRTGGEPMLGRLSGDGLSSPVASAAGARATRWSRSAYEIHEPGWLDPTGR